MLFNQTSDKLEVLLHLAICSIGYTHPPGHAEISSAVAVNSTDSSTHTSTSSPASTVGPGSSVTTTVSKASQSKQSFAVNL